MIDIYLFESVYLHNNFLFGVCAAKTDTSILNVLVPVLLLYAVPVVLTRLSCIPKNFEMFGLSLNSGCPRNHVQVRAVQFSSSLVGTYGCDPVRCDGGRVRPALVFGLRPGMAIRPVLAANKTFSAKRTHRSVL
jgi:hypothetical protein